MTDEELYMDARDEARWAWEDDLPILHRLSKEIPREVRSAWRHMPASYWWFLVFTTQYKVRLSLSGKDQYLVTKTMLLVQARLSWP